MTEGNEKRPCLAAVVIYQLATYLMTNLSLVRTINRSLAVARPTRCMVCTAQHQAIAVGIPHLLRNRHPHLLRNRHVVCTARNRAITVGSPHLLRHISVTQAITASSIPWLIVLRWQPPPKPSPITNANTCPQPHCRLVIDCSKATSADLYQRSY